MATELLDEDILAAIFSTRAEERLEALLLEESIMTQQPNPDQSHAQDPTPGMERPSLPLEALPAPWPVPPDASLPFPAGHPTAIPLLRPRYRVLPIEPPPGQGPGLRDSPADSGKE